MIYCTHERFAQLAALAIEKTFVGIDPFGWGVIFFLLLLIGVPYTRYFLRAAAIPDWPIVSARVSVISGVPPGFADYPFEFGRIPRLIPYHCRVSYVFPVDGAVFEGWFLMLALDRASAEFFCGSGEWADRPSEV